MTKRTVPDLKEIFKQASEIAQQVPEAMQEAAFNRALDLLTDAPEAEEGPKQKRDRSSSKDSDHVSVDELLQRIDSTQHPGVRSATKVLDRSLMILQIALNDHSIDGLTPVVAHPVYWTPGPPNQAACRVS